MPDKIQIRRDTAANWTSFNPILSIGEIGLETNTRKFKVGDGTTLWAALQYWGDGYDGNPATIQQNASNRFVSDTEKNTWNAKADSLGADDNYVTDAEKVKLSNLSGVNTGDQDLSGKSNVGHAHPESEITNLVNDLAGKSATTHNHDATYEAKNSNIQAHIASAHAPSDAQKNSDITKAEIEAKLTGVISSHSHSGGGGLGYTINVQALTSSPADAATIYFGMLPKAPTTTANISKVHIRKAGTIKSAQIYCYSGTAGTNESWSIYIRLNNTTDTLIATIGAATSERIFSNDSLSIAVSVGDYIEIKCVNPTWATNPLTTIFGGYIYIE